jgi:hypothetical protein
MLDVNYLAVLACGVAYMIVGFLWYGPLFGKTFMEGMGWNPSDSEAMKARMSQTNMPLVYLQSFIGAMIMAYVLAHVIIGMNMALDRSADFMTGLSSGFWVWLGFVLPVVWGKRLWEQKAFKYVAVDLGYYLVVLMIAGVILSLWV